MNEPRTDNQCPVCGSVEYVAVTRGDQRYRHCGECGLLHLEGTVTLQATTRFYTKEGGNPTEAISSSKRRLYNTVLRRASRQHGGPGRLLDVGCGRGDFLLAAKEKGWDVVGIEPVTELVEQGRQTGLEIHAGTLDNLPKEAGPFDLVTYWDVLVFVPDPQQEMRLIAGLLAPGGRFYARLRQHAVVRALDSVWPLTGGLLDLTNPAVYHPMNYEPRTLRRLLSEQGFRGSVRGGRLTAGDSYSVGRKHYAGLVAAGKIIVDTVARVVERISRGRLILSPTMECWGESTGN